MVEIGGCGKGQVEIGEAKYAKRRELNNGKTTRTRSYLLDVSKGALLSVNGNHTQF